MAEISASTVMELRQRTGLGMMECKKALTEAEGDVAKAEELLRIKSGAKASKAAGRVAAEGVIGLYTAADGKVAAMVEINCETDFVAATTISGRSPTKSRKSSPRTTRATWRRSPRGRSRRASTVEARRVGARAARSARTCPLRRFVRLGSAGPCRVVTCTARASASSSTYTGGNEALGQGSRDAHRGDEADGASAASACRPTSSRRSGRSPSALRRRIGQACQHRRKNGRRCRRQIPGRGHAVCRNLSSRTTRKPSTRSSRRRVPASTASCSTSSAKASRSARTISQRK